jgi:alpha-tubulin suppressor-like RCC1 family protein
MKRVIIYIALIAIILTGCLSQLEMDGIPNTATSPVKTAESTAEPEPTIEPTPMPPPLVIIDNPFVFVSAGRNHSTAIREDGSLWTWGWNNHGQLGDGMTDDCYEPRKVMDDVAFVAAGGKYTMAIKTDGSLWAFGANDYGQFGLGEAGADMEFSSVPVHIMDDVKWVSVSMDDRSGYDSFAHTMIVKTDGSLWGWGGNAYGQLGDGTFEDRAEPVFIMDGVKTVSVGRMFEEWVETEQVGLVFEKKTMTIESSHTVAVRNDGTVWTWGKNDEGQLGDGTYENRNVPVLVMENAVMAEAGGVHTLVLTAAGVVWAWGANDRFQLSIDIFRWCTTKSGIKIMNNEPDNNNEPVRLKIIQSYAFDKIVEKATNLEDAIRMTEESMKDIDDIFLSVSAGASHGIAVTDGGILWTWGNNNREQLGRENNRINKPTAQVVLENVTRVSAGNRHNLAIMNDGSLWAWGDNGYGQIGVDPKMTYAGFSDDYYYQGDVNCRATPEKINTD